ncbi:GLPGLI family protein [Moheibacter lacus]|uniref:GLPGLI family protein n=1 Tax=Moheibacter lacus TaxID=2745851 RepID=A0A838ZT06_9FLAO|nr:GLPGLI family protein [Moheibacter lacus]MBA5630118.1 GLPGLI family protein [Moheibacter lacus]
MHRYFFLFLILFTTNLFSQINFESDKLTKITYLVSSNGNTDENQNPIWVLADKEKTLITSRDNFQGNGSFPFEMTFIQPDVKSYSQFAFLNSTESISMKDLESIGKQEFELIDETKKILGYNCKKAKTMINSNTIEIWYTNDLRIKGGPSVLGADLGLVLEMVRNGNYAIQAIEIKKEKVKIPEIILNSKPIQLEKIDYQDKIWKSRFTTIPVFENQLIHWSEEFEPRENVMRFANGTIAVKKIKFPKLNTKDQIFVQLIEQSNGDAYDRTGTVFLIPTDKKQSFLDGLQNGAKYLPVFSNGNGKEYQGVVATENFEPLVELMRFFTPFGVKHFNDRLTLKGKVWQDSVMYRQDIAHFADLMSEKEAYIGVFIGNYDKGGHQISMEITIHKEEASNSPLKKIVPLFNTLNVMEMAGQEYGTMFDSENGLIVEFELKENLKNTKLRYTTTGHGGWENGDEYLQKKNTVSLDGEIVFDLTPWREDCGSYRLYNPVSGNFPNGLSSSDYSRSNWCPGTVTNPFIIDLGDLKKGKHKIQVQIPQGKPEGSSFSAWNVSGVLVGD